MEMYVMSRNIFRGDLVVRGDLQGLNRFLSRVQVRPEPPIWKFSSNPPAKASMQLPQKCAKRQTTS